MKIKNIIIGLTLGWWMTFPLVMAQNITYKPMYSDAIIDATVIDMSLATGSTIGESSVSNGQAGYMIPMVLPPGTGNVMPKLALNYGSNGGSSHFGRGWGLSGLSVISRVGQSIQYDGQVTEMNYDHTDRYVMDGNRLLLSVGAYGLQNSQYVFEAQNFSKITSYGGTYGDPGYFIMETKEGVKYEYGNDNGSRHLSDYGQAKAWYLSKMVYPDGNYIEYKYKRNHVINGLPIDNELVIDEINYSGNAAAGITPFAKIKFNYKKKQYSNPAYIKGHVFNRSLLTSSIEITTENMGYRSYVFDYGLQNGEDFLVEVTEKAGDGSALNSTKFKYGDYPTGNNVQVSTIPFTTTTDYFPCNLEGDGITDILLASRVSMTNAYHTQFGGHSNQPFTVSLPSASNVVGVSDCNGDQVDDVLVLQKIGRDTLNDDGTGNPYYVHYDLYHFSMYHNQDPNGALGFDDVYTLPDLSQDTVLNANAHLSHLYGGDFDADGLSDYIFINGTKVYISYGQRNITAPLQAWQEVTATTGSFTGLANWASQVERLYIIDFDGDGRSDIFMVNGPQTVVFEFDSDTHLNVVFWQDDAGLSLQTRLFDQQYLIWPGDFNGDGKTDFLKKVGPNSNDWGITHSTGTGFVTTQITLPTNPSISQPSFGSYQGSVVSVGDYNGDGKSDMIHIGGAGTMFVALYYSNGYTFLPHEYNYQYGFLGSSMSYSGPSYTGIDGKARTIYRAYSGLDPLEVGIAPQSKENLLVKVKNGELHTTIFDYKLMTEKIDISDDFYVRGPLTNAITSVSNVQVPSWLVKDYKVQNGINAGSNYTDGAMKVQSLKYAHAKLHRLGRGILGFGMQSMEDKWSYLRTKSYYGVNDQFNILLPDSTIVEFVTGQDFVKTDNDYEVLPVYPNRYLTRAQTITTYNYHENRETSQQFISYDAYGNCTQANLITYSGASHQLIEHKNTMTQFGAFGSPIPDKPTQIKLTLTRPGQAAYSSIAKFTYTSLGQLETKKEFFGEPKEVTTAYEYHPHGGIKKTTKSGPSMPTQILHTDYEPKGRFITEKRNTDNNIVYSATHYIPASKPQTETDETGLTTTYSYDPWGRVFYIVPPNGRPKSIEYNWDAVSGIKSVRTYGPDQPDQKVYYDQMGRKKKSEVTGFNNEVIEETFSYDLVGNLYQGTAPHKAGESILTTTNTYDVAYTSQRIKGMSTNVPALGNTTYAYTYDQGNEIRTVTAPDGKVSSEKIDASGKVIQTTDNAGNVLDFVYYGHGGLKEVKQGSTVLVAIEYDEYNRKKKQTDLSAGITQYTYDGYGRLETETNAKGQVTTMTYDQYDRPHTITRPEGVTTNEYWPAGSIGKAFKLKKVTGHAGDIEEWDYNSKGLLTSHTIRIDVYYYTTNYFYNIADQLIKKTLPGGIIYEYEYDSHGYLKRIYNGSTNYVIIDEVNGRGQITQYTSGNGKVSIHDYFHGIPTRYRTSDLTFDYQMVWDYKSGNLKSRTDQYGNKDTITYDNLDRIHTWTRSNLIQTIIRDTLTYASNGNILKKTDVGVYTYDPVRVHAVSEVSNPAGVIRDPEQDIVYNSFLQPVSIEEANFRLEYTYGHHGNRIMSVLKKNGTIIQTRQHYGEYEKVTDSTGTYFVAYLSTDGHLIVIMHSDGTTVTPHYTYTDHLGSIVMVTNAAGSIEAQQNFDPWGRRRLPSTWEYMDENLPLNLPKWLYRGYTGHEHLPQFHLINMNGRLYDPEVGRMLSPDNYIQDGGYFQNYNRYSYALNNPLKYTDPSGEVILPLLVSVGIGLLTNGLSNTMDGKPFFQGATRSIAFSILTYGISSGIGDAAKAAVEKGLLKASEVFVFQAMAHGFAGGLISAMQGGKFMHGFASGGLSSLASSASIALQALKAGPVPTVLIGGIAGGLGSVISGGDFFNGFRYGAISSAFNHVTHALMEGGDNDPLPDGRKLWELSSEEFALFANAETRSQVTGCECDIQLSIAEQLYLIGKALSLVNPTAKLPTVVAKSAETTVESGAKLSSNSVKLSKQLASEAQMVERGRPIIESGKLNAGVRLAEQYGGNSFDWVKMSSSSFTKNGTTFETHWYQNLVTGLRVEYKTKFP